MSFYLTLPSTTSFDFFPDNTAGQFTTKLPQPINLKEDFEVGLSEIQFNSSYINVSEDACFVDYKNAEENEKTRIRIIPGMFSNNEDFIKIINERIQQDYGFEDITFSYDKMTRRVTVRVSNKATIKLSPNLARLLGFKNPKINGPHQRYAQGIMDLNEDYHSIFVYCDIVTQWEMPLLHCSGLFLPSTVPILLFIILIRHLITSQSVETISTRWKSF